MNEISNNEELVHLSIKWILLAVVIVVALSFVSSIVVQSIIKPTLPPLTNNANHSFSPVSNNITISPNVSVSEIIESIDQSILLIGDNKTKSKLFGTGVVITNDGLVATSANLPNIELSAFDNKGRVLPLSLLGRDALYNITYLKITKNVVTPIDIRHENSMVGHTLLSLSRNNKSFTPSITSHVIKEYSLAPATMPLGVQRVMMLQNNNLSESAILVDEEGKMAGIVIDAQAGIGLPVNEFNISFNRATSKERELNPLKNLGVFFDYSFTRPNDNSSVEFTATFKNAPTGSPAFIAGIRKGDQLLSINGKKVSIENSIVEQLSTKKEITLVIRRGNQEKTLQLPVDKI